MVNISPIKSLAFLIIPAILLPLVFIYDVIRAAVEFDNASMTMLRELFVIGSFTLIGLFIEKRQKMTQRNAPREIGRVFFAVILSLIIIGNWFVHSTSSNLRRGITPHSPISTDDTCFNCSLHWCLECCLCICSLSSTTWCFSNAARQPGDIILRISCFSLQHALQIFRLFSPKAIYSLRYSSR